MINKIHLVILKELAEEVLYHSNNAMNDLPWSKKDVRAAIAEADRSIQNDYPTALTSRIEAQRLSAEIVGLNVDQDYNPA